MNKTPATRLERHQSLKTDFSWTGLERDKTQIKEEEPPWLNIEHGHSGIIAQPETAAFNVETRCQSTARYMTTSPLMLTSRFTLDQ